MPRKNEKRHDEKEKTEKTEEQDKKSEDGEHYDPLEKYKRYLTKERPLERAERASYLKRTLAFIFDILLLDLLLFWPFELTIQQVIPQAGTAGISEMLKFVSDNPAIYSKLAGIILIIGMITLAYFMLMEYMLGQTLGKMLFNLRVIRTETDIKTGKNRRARADISEDQKPALWQCFLRNIWFIPVFPLILLWIVDPAYVFFNPKGQRLTEFISNTMVIDEAPLHWK